MTVIQCKTAYRPDASGSRILPAKMPGDFSLPTQIF